MEIEKSKADFKYLYKIVSIDIDRIKFRKYEITKSSSIVDKPDYEIVELGKELGEEIHICKPDVIYESAGKVGSIIKGFEVVLFGKSRKKVFVSKILWMD